MSPLAATVRSVLVAFLALACCGERSLPAQQFHELGKRHLPEPANWRPGPLPLAWIDVDGDGDLDLLMDGAHLRLLRNDGGNVYSDVTATHLPELFFSPEVVPFDADGDGRPDLLLTPWTGVPRLLLNDGSGRYADAPAGQLPPLPRSRFAVLDVESDGDSDLIASASTTGDRLLLNDGSGRFVEVFGRFPPGPVTGRSWIVTADLDVDGDTDVLWSVSGVDVTLLQNDGVGMFTAAQRSVLPPNRDTIVAVVVAELTGDSAPDLLLRLGGPTGGHRLWANLGNGRFVDRSATLPGGSTPPHRLAVLDADGDGRRDLFGTRDGDGGGCALWLGTASGAFVATTGRLPAGPLSSGACLVGDVEGDGDDDVLVATDRMRLFLNGSGAGAGKGWFVDANAPLAEPLPAWFYAVVIGDFTGDGLADYVELRTDPHLHVAAAHGGFALRTGAFPTGAKPQSWGGTAFDRDGDGDLDLLLFGSYVARMYDNDGGARFTDVTVQTLPAIAQGGYRAVVADADADGDEDLFLVVDGGDVMVLRNDGSGRFDDGDGHRANVAWTDRLAAADIDGDGDPDLVAMGDRPNQPRRAQHLIRNDGDRGLNDVTASHLPPLNVVAVDFAIADLDGDGDPDIVQAVAGARSRWLANDGLGRFTVAASLPPIGADDKTTHVAATDVDGDGDVDLLVAAGSLHLFVNDGTGMFTDVTGSRLPYTDLVDGLQLADFDGDGDGDVLAGRRFLFNSHRQLSVPYVTRTGGVLEVDVHAAPGYAAGPRTVVPFVAAGGGKLHLPPLGTLWLQVATLVADRPVVLDPRTGSDRRRYPVPLDASLVGARLWLQAAIGDPAATPPWRLTNLVVEPITGG